MDKKRPNSRYTLWLCLVVGSIGAVGQALIIPARPVFVGPLSYWLTFELCVLFGPYNAETMTTRNFDGYPGETARYQFAFEVLTLLGWGLVIGLASGAAIPWFTYFVRPWTVRSLR